MGLVGNDIGQGQKNQTCAYLNLANPSPLGAPPGWTLVKPFEAAAAMVSQLGVSGAVLCVPTPSQQAYSLVRWRTRLPVGAALRTYVLPEEPTDQALRLLAASVSLSGEAVVRPTRVEPPDHPSDGS